MNIRIVVAALTVVSILGTARGADLDVVLASENRDKSVDVEPVSLVDDLGFARRLCLDLTGRIPTGKEIAQYLRWSEKERRAKLIDRYMDDPGFANRWSAFFADMLRIRSSKEGGTELLAYVHHAVRTDMPYDEMCRRMISVNGKEGRTPEVGYVLGDDADPMALASSTAQVFMGIRISCAQCHDHPFDVWTREDFYSVAAYFGKTERRQNRLTNTIYTTEGNNSTVLWPPEDESDPQQRSPMKPSFPFPYLDESENLAFIDRLETMRAEQAAKEAGRNRGPSVDDLLAAAGNKTKKRLSGGMGDMLKVSTEAKSDIRKIDVNADLYRKSELRKELAGLVTSPRNRFFARSLVNRVWKDLIGTGFVEPIDDFREDNPASHPKTMDFLAEEFVANGFRFRWLVRQIVSSDAYARDHVALDADENVRSKLESHFLATPMRRMKAEAMFDSIVTAGHLFDVKHRPGQNEKTILTRVRVPVESSGEGGSPSQTDSGYETNAEMARESEKMVSSENYGLEQAIELDFNALLMPKDDAPMLDSMKMMSRKEIEAMRMKAMPKPKPGTKYVTKMVEKVIDDNPMFSSAYRMATPAPPGHFLRLFGQPSRVDLGEERMDNASMRQALMMLNGKLTNEAARVGELEPIYPMMVGPKKDLRRAVRYTYFEILTRLPTEAEIAEAMEIIDEGETHLAGMADLRWVLLNCNEFRFVP